jgi:antagonist of KipI
MSLLFLKSGVLTTLQDLGRRKFRRFGINPNGAMDERALRLANILLGNDENAAAFEMHFPSPEILFEAPATIALGGADFAAKINDLAVENWRPIFVEKDSVLKFSRREFGARIYLAVRGGLQIENWLGSASTNLLAKVGGFHGRALQKGDRIHFNSELQMTNSTLGFKVSPSLLPIYSGFPTVRVVAGAEWENLTQESQMKFLSDSFKINLESDRMGFRLAGGALRLRAKSEILSSAVDFGTIQLLPDGQLIILMADHQTTGGYPRVAHVAKADLPLVAQLAANDKLNFQLTSLADAENALCELEKESNLLRWAVKLR